MIARQPRALTAWTRARRLMAPDAGMTIVEVMVAVLILVIGSIAVLSAVDTAARSAFRAEQSQVVVNRLQEEAEKIRQLPFEEVALTGVPAHDSNQTSPAWRVSGTNFALAKDGSATRPMVYNGGSLQGGGTITGGTVASGPTPFASGDVHGQIYRYIVWLNDDSCPESKCPGSQDIKRVIIAALLDTTASGGQQAYQEIHADLTNPDASPVDNPLPPGQDEPAAWQFWLTDTPCSFNSRQPITGEHLTHNTLGTCANGLKTGGTAGAPDLMFTEAPPLNNSFPPDAQPLYDYATDVEPTSNAGQDRGLQLKSPSGLLGQTGCLPMNLGGLTETNKQWKVHRWLSPAIPNGYDVLLNGHGSLSLWTQTINGAVHPGRICVYLFTRQLNGLGVPIDTPVLNLDDPVAVDHFPYSQASWPNGNWGEIEIPMHFAAANGGALHLLPGTRLGLAIGVHRNGTLPGDGLQFNYDTPSFDSRLEVQSSSLLPIF